MLRLASHQLVRASARSIQPATRVAGRRFASSGAAKPRSWKSLAVRLGLAGGAVYLYNTNGAFAEQAESAVTPHPAAASPTQPQQHDTEKLPTLEEIAVERRKRTAEAQKAAEKAKQEEEAAARTSNEGASGPPEVGAGGVEGLEEEAAQQGAFNEETGEINWDCPCLGGMADGPCGEQFKDAFSCFVFSKEEPKGVDCIDKFKNMQDCFRLYPDIYGAELEDEDLEGLDVDTEKGDAEATRTAEARSEAEPHTASSPNPTKKAADAVGNDVAPRTEHTDVSKPSEDPSIASKAQSATSQQEKKAAEETLPKEFLDGSDVTKPAAKK